MEETDKKTENYSKILVSTRGENGPVMLEAQFTKDIHVVKDRIESLCIKIELRIINGPYRDLKHAQNQRDYDWEITVSRDALKGYKDEKNLTVDFHNSLYMVPLAFGLGFGSFLMNEIVHDLKKYFPEAKAFLTLGVELDPVKKERRERFYKKFDMKVGYTDEETGFGSVSIERVGDLKVFSEIKGVTAVVSGDEIKKLIEQNILLEKELEEKEHVNQNLNSSISFYQDRYDKCSTKYWNLVKSGAVLIAIAVLAFYVMKM